MDKERIISRIHQAFREEYVSQKKSQFSPCLTTTGLTLNLKCLILRRKRFLSPLLQVSIQPVLLRTSLNLVESIYRYTFQTVDIWKCDETGVANIQKLRRVLTMKGTKLFGFVTSVQGSHLVTCTAACTIGTFVSPMFVLSFKNDFIQDGPISIIGGIIYYNGGRRNSFQNSSIIL